jgi:CheY-like chemotaxis protein
VAHDFNNLLQAIVGNTEILLMDVREGHPGHANLMRIRQTSLKAKDLVQQLLTFSRKIESRRVPVNLNREIEQTCALLARTLSKMIEIELRLAPDLNPVEADPTQIGQVLMNLAINAQDAMPDGGRILIETGNRNLSESFCRLRPGLIPGDYAILFFSDTGTGMDPETQKRIFEPFFTTKGVGKGTGLGMAMVYGIIKSHQGFIYCRSEPGRGTTFEIYFHTATQRAVGPLPENHAQPKGGGETILLVDDEPWLLDLGVQILNRFGYRTLSAPSGEEALMILERNGTPVDLIIMDLLMPGMGGRKCLEQVAQTNPSARFIVASGFAEEGTMEEVRKLGARGIIQKPYAVEELLKTVRGALEAG